MSLTALLWAPLPLLWATPPQPGLLPKSHPIWSAPAQPTIPLLCHLPQPPSQGRGCTAPTLHTRHHSVNPPPSPLSCNYVEQTRAADGKGAAISLTFRDWSCWEEMGRPMERGAPEAGGMGEGRLRKGGGERTCSELLMGRIQDRKSRRDREQKEDREEDLRRMEQSNRQGRGGRQRKGWENKAPDRCAVFIPRPLTQSRMGH